MVFYILTMSLVWWHFNFAQVQYYFFLLLNYIMNCWFRWDHIRHRIVVVVFVVRAFEVAVVPNWIGLFVELVAPSMNRMNRAWLDSLAKRRTQAVRPISYSCARSRDVLVCRVAGNVCHKCCTGTSWRRCELNCVAVVRVWFWTFSGTADTRAMHWGSGGISYDSATMTLCWIFSGICHRTGSLVVCPWLFSDDLAWKCKHRRSLGADKWHSRECARVSGIWGPIHWPLVSMAWPVQTKVADTHTFHWADLAESSYYRTRSALGRHVFVHVVAKHRDAWMLRDICHIEMIDRDACFRGAANRCWTWRNVNTQSTGTVSIPDEFSCASEGLSCARMTLGTHCMRTVGRLCGKWHVFSDPTDGRTAYDIARTRMVSLVRAIAWYARWQRRDPQLGTDRNCIRAATLDRDSGSRGLRILAD